MAHRHRFGGRVIGAHLRRIRPLNVKKFNTILAGTKSMADITQTSDDERDIDAFQEGWEAAEQQETVEVCPYDFDTKKGKSWLDGYIDGGGQE